MVFSLWTVTQNSHSWNEMYKRNKRKHCHVTREEWQFGKCVMKSGFSLLHSTSPLFTWRAWGKLKKLNWDCWLWNPVHIRHTNLHVKSQKTATGWGPNKTWQGHLAIWEHHGAMPYYAVDTARIRQKCGKVHWQLLSCVSYWSPT